MFNSQIDQTYAKIIDNLITARGKWETYAKECEEFFYQNVDGTHTQFTRRQLELIKKDYDIQVSINILFPVVEQLISFLIGNKPSVRILPVGEADKNIAYMLQELWSGLWYRCKGQVELKEALKDCLITGWGFLMIEPTNFFQQNPFGIVINHVPWRYVYIDPNSRKQDLSDSEYIMVAKQVSAQKAARMFNISAEDLQGWGLMVNQSGIGNDLYTEVTTKPVVIHEIFQKELIKQPGFLGTDGKIKPQKEFENDTAIQPGVYIKRTLLLERNKLIWQGFLPIKEYPVIPLCCVYQSSGEEGNVGYGIIHYIMDPQKAMNKALAHIILNAQLHGHAKMLIPEGSVEPQKVYDWAADPRRALEYKIDPNNPESKPERIPPAPLAAQHYQLFQELIKMVEYITGIYSVMQGNPDAAPSTFGATQSLQVYGTQRVKMRAGSIDNSMAILAHVAITYMITYAKPGQLYRYINDQVSGMVQDPNTGQMVQQQQGKNEPWREVRLVDKPDVSDYDIVTSPNPSTPTTRMLASMLLGNISGQTRDPQVANLLTQYSLKLLDIPEADEIVQKVDTISQMQQQLQQLQQQLQQIQQQAMGLQKENENLKKKEIEMEYEKEVSDKALETKITMDAEKKLAMEEIKRNKEEEIAKQTTKIQQKEEFPLNVSTIK